MHHVTDGNNAYVRAVFKVSRGQRVSANLVEDVALVFPRPEISRRCLGDCLVQDLFSFVDVGAVDDMIVHNGLNDGNDVSFGAWQLDRKLRSGGHLIRKRGGSGKQDSGGHQETRKWAMA